MEDLLEQLIKEKIVDVDINILRLVVNDFGRNANLLELTISNAPTECLNQKYLDNRGKMSFDKKTFAEKILNREQNEDLIQTLLDKSPNLKLEDKYFEKNRDKINAILERNQLTHIRNP